MAPVDGATDNGWNSPHGALHSIAIESKLSEGCEALTIRVANDESLRDGANNLLKRMYAWRGYGSNHSLRLGSSCVSFTAEAANGVIGTLSLTVDSADGLACDSTFKEELDRFRSKSGTRLCELTRLAFDTSIPARPRLAALFHTIFIYGSLHYDCTDLFIEVNPKHRRFYEAMLGFTSIGTPKLNPAVNAPAQLMWLSVADIRRQISLHAGRPAHAGTSLYGHFFPAEEEAAILRRLACAYVDQATATAVSRLPLPNSWNGLAAIQEQAA